MKKLQKIGYWDENSAANESHEMIKQRSPWEVRIQEIPCWNQEDGRRPSNPFPQHSSNYVFLGYLHGGRHPPHVPAKLGSVLPGNHQHPGHDLHRHSHLCHCHHSPWHHLYICAGRFRKTQVSFPLYLQKPRLPPENLLFCLVLVIQSCLASL